MGWVTVLALAWAFGLGLSWLRVDLWLRRLAPPEWDEPDAAAARRLWLEGRRTVALPVWVIVPCWLLLGVILHPFAGGVLAPSLALAAMLPALIMPRVFLRFALRKQFPHLTGLLPGWWTR